MAAALLFLAMLAAQDGPGCDDTPVPACAAASAQTQPTADHVVTAPTLPNAPIAAAFGELVIDAAALAAVPRPSIEALLPQIPGAQQFRRSDSRSSNPSAQGLTLRALGGNAAARTLILRDGVPVADPFFGSVPFNSLLLTSTQQISVTPGAGAGPFGGGAIAGVLEIASADPVAPSDVNMALGRGSFATMSASLAANRRLGHGGIRFAVAGERSDGFWTTPADQRVAASVPASYRNWAVELAGTALAADGRLDVRLGVFDDRRTLRFAGADSRSQGADLSARWIRDGRGRWNIEAVGWVQLRDFAATTVSAATFRPVLDQRATPTVGWGGKLELRPPLIGQRTLRLGIDLRGAEGRTDEVGLSPAGAVTLRRRAGGQTLLFGAFAEHDARTGPLTLGGGVRVDRWHLSGGILRESNAVGTTLIDQSFADRTTTRVTARTAASLDVAEGVMVRASAYRGFRVPTLNELFRPFVLFPVTTRANAALAPERLTGVEAGLSYRDGDHTGMTLTVFANQLDGAIANVTIGPNLRQRANLPSIRVHGIEFAGRYGLGDVGGLHIAGTWTDAQVDGGSIAPAVDGLRPAQVPRWSGAMTAFVNGPFGSRGALVLRHGARQFEDDRNADVLPAYAAIDAVALWRIAGRWTVGISAENLTGSRIVTRNSGGSRDLGAPRSLRLTLRIG